MAPGSGFSRDWQDGFAKVKSRIAEKALAGQTPVSRTDPSAAPDLVQLGSTHGFAACVGPRSVDLFSVPELTRGAGIQLNARVSLRSPANTIRPLGGSAFPGNNLKR